MNQRPTKKGNFIDGAGLGFCYSNQTELLEQMDTAKRHQNQHDMIQGPTGVPYQIEVEFQQSAMRLCSVHRKVAFDAAFSRFQTHKCDLDGAYARVLGKEHGERDLGKLCKPHLFGILDFAEPMIPQYRQYLLFLGDLHVFVVRCLENGVVKRDIDLRRISPANEMRLLDEQGVRSTNERNPYRAYDWPQQAHRVLAFHQMWQKQHDVQINTLEMYLRTGSWENLHEKANWGGP